MAMEDKSELSALMGCNNRWGCRARPAIILSDREPLLITDHVREVLVRRFHITKEIAPPYVPPIKGAVEAAFHIMTERLEHRLPGTTKGSPQARGQYDSKKEAAKACIRTEDLYRLWIRAWVDGYMIKFNTLRDGTPAELWQAQAKRWGVRQWDGSDDELKLLLMKVVNHKFPDNPERGFNVYPANTLSVWVTPMWQSRMFGSMSIFRCAPAGPTLRTIYLFDNHNRLVTEAYHSLLSLSPVPVSLAERKLVKADQRQRAAQTNQASADALTQIVADAHASPAQKERERIKVERALEQQRLRRFRPVHTDQAQAMLEKMSALAQTAQATQGAGEVRSGQTAPADHDSDRAATIIDGCTDDLAECDDEGYTQRSAVIGGPSLLPAIGPNMERRARRGSVPPPPIRILSRDPDPIAPRRAPRVPATSHASPDVAGARIDAEETEGPCP